jgi:site-specific recombinase XerD
MLRIVNQDLKTIGENAKISEKLTTYVARHSFATNLKKVALQLL